MLSIEAGEAHHDLIADGFRLQFVWRTDRWQHRISVESGGETRCLAATPDADDSTGGVLSPTFQHIQVPDRDPSSESVVALLVGQSGTHHFSGAFTLRKTTEGILVQAELADRTGRHDAPVASHYLVDLAPGSLIEAREGVVRWPIPGRDGWTIEFEAEPPARLDLSEAGRRRCLVQASRVEPSVGQTRCWSYAWLLRRPG
jgi:hypothetical protein